MPMRWSPENDQTLLLKILETSHVTVDAKAISELWPSKDGEAKPTPRAITERLVKIREHCRATGSGGFSVSSAGPKKPRATPVTPRKPRVNTHVGPKKDMATAKTEATHEAKDEVPGLVHGSGGWSSGNSSQPPTPASSGMKRTNDDFKIESGPPSNDDDLYSSDMPAESPSKRIKSASFGGPYDAELMIPSFSFAQRCDYVDDGAY